MYNIDNHCLRVKNTVCPTGHNLIWVISFFRGD